MNVTRIIRRMTVAAAAALALATAPLVNAELSDEQLARLGRDLTPLGAIRAGNADGTIPEWTGGLTEPPAGFSPGHWVNPFADERPLFTITAQNYRDYADKLSPGQIAMFEKYPSSFRMHVYPTHRTAGYAQWVYDATRRQAKAVKICEKYDSSGEICLENEVEGGGIPFPIPKSAEEVGMNLLLAYRGKLVEFYSDGALTDALGNRVDVVMHNREAWPWWTQRSGAMDNDWFWRDGIAWLCDSWQVLQPPRSSGLVFGGCSYTRNLDFQAYLYIPGQRRVRRAPEIGFHDSPSFASDGQRTVSSRWMWWFGGKKPRHDYELRGPVEMYVPYNSYRIMDPNVSLDELFGKKHINPELIRYELHRVWIIDSKLKPGQRHLYKRHVAYIDEDSWHGVMFEAYDAKDRLWRWGEQYNIQLYDQPLMRPMGDQQVDLINGRYTTYPYWHVQVGRMLGKEPGIWFGDEQQPPFDVSIYTPQGLRKFGRR